MPLPLGPFGGVPFGAVASLASSTARARPRAARAPVLVDGDYQRDGDGNLVEGDPVFEEVAFLLSTRQGTFVAVPDRGNGVFTLRAFTDHSEVEVRDHVMRALEPAIRRGVIDTVSVVARPRHHDASTAHLEYTVTYRKTGRVEP